MKFNELVNKEVIDQNGDSIGKVKDIEWDNETKKIVNIEIGGGGIKGAIGMSDRKILPFDNVENIGDKVLLKKPAPEISEKTEELELDLDRYNI